MRLERQAQLHQASFYHQTSLRCHSSKGRKANNIKILPYKRLANDRRGSAREKEREEALTPAAITPSDGPQSDKARTSKSTEEKRLMVCDEVITEEEKRCRKSCLFFPYFVNEWHQKKRQTEATGCHWVNMRSYVNTGRWNKRLKGICGNTIKVWWQ